MQFNYWIMYGYGEHHILVKTDKDSFFRSYKHLLEEFKIIVDISNDEYINFFIINYYGDREFLGQIEIKVQ